jgi:metallo-beta-lactamase family protein
MATGGRVVHHLVAFAPDARNAILLAGFQAGGTRGARLAAGDRTLRIFGEDIPVRAEVVQLGASSAHADSDGLIAWLRSAPQPPRRVFVTHGEPAAADALRLRIERELGWAADVPDWLQAIDLHAAAGRVDHGLDDGRSRSSGDVSAKVPPGIHRESVAAEAAPTGLELADPVRD